MSVAARAFTRLSPLRAAEQTFAAQSVRAYASQRPLTPAEFGEQKDELFKKVAQKIGSSDPTAAEYTQAIFSDPQLEKEFNRLAELHPIQYAGGDRMSQDFNVAASTTKEPVRVAITGAAGSIGYATLFRIANGEMLGKDQPVILQCLEVGPGLNAMKGVAMELEDCAFPLLRGVTMGDDPKKVFEGADYAMLIGAKPRGKGMERGDLLRENASIFKTQGQALNDVASKDCKVVVVGNPANTNALITSAWAPNLAPENITAMTMLDQTRAIGQVCAKTGALPHQVQRVAIWGNHSATQYPDLSHATIDGKKATDVISDEKWVKETFIPAVQKRGAEVIAARGASSAASAGNAAIEHVRNWALGSEGRWVSMAVPSDGSYGVDKGLWYSKPVLCEDGSYSAIANVPIDPFSAEKMEATRKELVAERDAVKDMLP